MRAEGVNLARQDRAAGAEQAGAEPAARRAPRARREAQRRQPDPVLLSATGSAIELASLVFDPVWYVAQYPDVGAAGVDPVQHFMRNGFAEGRNPNPYFDGAWYARTYPDVAAHGENPFVHYVFYGAREGRRPRS